MLAGLVGILATAGFLEGSWLAYSWLETAETVVVIENQTANVATVVPVPQPPPLSLTFVGDLMLDRSVKSSIKKNGAGDYNWIFSETGRLAGTDILFANLEGPLSDKGKMLGGVYSFRMEPAALEAIKNAGFDVLAIANNHIGDWGEEAFLDTLFRLESAGIVAVGGGRNYAEAAAVKIVKRQGQKIGFLAFSDVGPEWLAASADKAGILLASDPNFGSLIKRAADQVNVLIVSLHFGDEYQTAPSERQKTLARLAIDNGAKIVIGHHSHIIQPVERYGGAVIAYSLGNFIFDQGFSPETMEGLVLTITVSGGNIVNVKEERVVLDNFFKPHLTNA